MKKCLYQRKWWVVLFGDEDLEDLGALFLVVLEVETVPDGDLEDRVHHQEVPREDAWDREHVFHDPRQRASLRLDHVGQVYGGSCRIEPLSGSPRR
jgi:hypothetical protein